jgi:hypothetical protein
VRHHSNLSILPHRVAGGKRGYAARANVWGAFATVSLNRKRNAWRDRCVQSPRGERWWGLADVCAVLEVANSRDIAAGLDTDEKDDVGTPDAIGREQ